MKRFLMFSMMMLCALAAAAGDDTQTLLRATRINSRIALTVTGTSVTFVADARGSSGAFTDSRNFASPGGVTFYLDGFNPLAMKFKVTEERSAEPVTKGSGDFLDVAMGVAKAIGLGGGGPGSTASLTGTPEEQRAKALTSLANLSEHTLDQKTRDSWIKLSQNAAGVGKAQEGIQTFIDLDQAKIDTALAHEKVLTGGDRFAADQIIAQHQQLVKNLTALKKALAPFAIEGNWSNSTQYMLLRTESDPNQQDKITVTLTPLVLTEQGTLDTDPAAKEVTRSVFLRQSRRLVPEFGAAAVYNDLRYPKYTAKVQDGKKVVFADGFESSNLNAAATMNLLCDCFGGDFVFPGLQVGVSKAKDYPGLMAGVVLRFAGIKRFALSAGRLVTWYKDLDKLAIGSEVASDNDIKADLKLRRSRTAFYVAAQITF